MEQVAPDGRDVAEDAHVPRERILHGFEQVKLQAGAPEFRGCRYLAAQIELKDESHPASQVARRIKGNLTAFFRTEDSDQDIEATIRAAAKSLKQL